MEALNLDSPGGVRFVPFTAPGAFDIGVIGNELVGEHLREALDTGTKMPEPGTEVVK